MPFMYENNYQKDMRFSSTLLLNDGRPDQAHKATRPHNIESDSSYKVYTGMM
jgi:hypothetical protein